MQLRTALRQAFQELERQSVPSSQLAAELLLMHLLGRDRGYLYSHPELDLPDQVTSAYFRLVAERATGKPTQYITGHQEFWGLDFEVTADVLIPRPETEHIIETVLELVARGGLKRDQSFRIVDVGTGSGCIILALASEFPCAQLFATDISGAALDVARRNASRLKMSERVTFVEGDLLSPFLDSGLRDEFDFVVSNPPYVSHGELEFVQREVRDFEPRIALGDLEDNNAIYRRLLPQAQAALKPGGHLVVEIGYSMRDAVLTLFREGWDAVEVRPDLSGIPRVVSARKTPLGA